MQYGHFDDHQREYIITEPQTPHPWINYPGMEDSFTIISNTALLLPNIILILAKYPLILRGIKKKKMLGFSVTIIPGLLLPKQFLEMVTERLSIIRLRHLILKKSVICTKQSLMYMPK